MPQSLAQMYGHLVFRTKKGEHHISSDIRKELYGYISGIFTNMKSAAVIVGGTSDHIHILFRMPRTITIAQVVEEVKTAATKWLKQRSSDYRNFHWQDGYGIFSVSCSHVDKVYKYIENQEQHHSMKAFQEEYIEFLIENKLEYDERYVWD